MKAVQINEFGDSTCLKLTSVPEPISKKGFVKIKVKAFGLNQVERYVRKGEYAKFSLPLTLGVEAAGEVVEDLEGHFQIGDKVITAMGGLMLSTPGSYAEYLLAPSTTVHRINSTLPWSEIASLPMAYMTSICVLDSFMRINSGDTLLIRGGTSSVGIAALLYAKARGLTVITTTRKSENFENLYNWGADFVVGDNGYIRDDVLGHYPGGISHAMELVGSTTVIDTLACVAPFGNVVVAGRLGGSTKVENFDLMGDIPNTIKLSYFGSGILGSKTMPFPRTAFDDVIRWRSENRIPSILSKVYSFEQIQRAHEELDTGNRIGKIVVEIP